MLNTDSDKTQQLPSSSRGQFCHRLDDAILRHAMRNAEKKPVVVIGTGDFARIARYYIEHDSEHPVVAHALSASLLDANDFLGLPLVAFEELSQRYPPDDH